MKDIEWVIGSAREAMNNGDAERFCEHLHTEIHTYLPMFAFPLVGIDARKKLQERLNSSFQLMRYHHEHVRVRQYADTAIATGIFTMSAVKNSGAQITEVGRFTFTFIREGEAWKCIAEHISSIPADGDEARFF